MSQNIQPDPSSQKEIKKADFAQGCLERLAKNALSILVVLVVSVILFSLARAAVYKIRPTRGDCT